MGRGLVSRGRSGSAAPISKVRRNRGAHPPFLAYSAAIFVWADLIGLLWEEESRNFERPVVKALFSWYTDHEVRRMRFQPFVFDRQGEQVPVTIEPMTQRDAEQTNGEPLWQTSWTSEALSDERFQRYAAKAGDELTALRYWNTPWWSISDTWRPSRSRTPPSMKDDRSTQGLGG